MFNNYMVKKSLAFKWWILLACLCGTLTITAGIGLMFTSAYLISCAALMPPISALSLSIVGVRFFGLSRGVFRYCERLIAHKVTFYLSSEFRLWFYRCLEPIAPAGLKQHKSGDLLKRLMADIETLELVFSRTVVPTFASVIIGVVMTFIMWCFDSSLVLPYLCGYLAAGILIPGIISFVCWKLGKRIADIKSDLYLATVDGVQGIADLVAFNRIDAHYGALIKKGDRLIKFQRVQNFITGISEPIQTVIMMLTALGCFIYAVPLVETGALDAVYLAVVTLGILASFEGVSALPQVFLFFSEIKKAYEDINEIVTTPLPANGAETLESVNRIEFENVTFSYSDTPVLSNISLSFEKGKRYAVVGSSGAGKSSLVNLLYGFWKPDNGEIRFDATSLSDLNQYSIPSCLSVSPQRSFFFNESVKSNFARIHPELNESEIFDSLRFALVDELFSNIDNALDTDRGEGGNQFSGGELRRLSLALSVAGSSDFIIWDEPGAGLDSERYADLLVNTAEMRHNKGVIIITHKISGLELADLIYVLHNGELVESGSYDDLITAGGYFSRMAKQQKKVLLFDQ